MAATPVNSDRLPAPVSDVDPAETLEWVESLDGPADHGGRTRARDEHVERRVRARWRR